MIIFRSKLYRMCVLLTRKNVPTFRAGLRQTHQRHNTQWKFVSLYYMCLCSVSNLFTAHCLEDKTKKTKVSGQEVDILLKQSDDFFQAGKFEDSLNLIYHLRFTSDAEILWRISRALYNLTKDGKMKKDEKNKKIIEAYGYVEEALILDGNNFAIHKWVAILVDAKAGAEGTKQRIEALPTFKQHLMRAIELNPKDATSIYMLGQYCFSIAAMPWYQRKIASALFATPPESSFEEALDYFIRAEQVEPNFYSLNLLMLGKTYLQLGRMEPARYWLQCARNYPVRTAEDDDARQEAGDILKKMPAPQKVQEQIK